MRTFILYILLLLPAVIFSQSKTDSVKYTIQIDSSKINIKEFSENLNEKYSSREFDYSIKDGESQNLLARFLSWIFKWLNDTFGIEIPENAGLILEIVIYVLLGLLAIYLLIRFLLGEKASGFFVKKDKHIAPLEIQEENIEKIDFDHLIKNAVEQNNYRLAVRYLYLKTLKNLSQAKVIDWHFEKTNSDYYNEIENEEIKYEYKKVSYLYDYVWYGEFNLDASSFKDANRRFNNLEKLINR
ncbi:DUF4129 domain-containing protein [Abyssalbus ytuae]|uniref:DUF4129 domain-containing protein n=1 Tax=Abyssalbus ytuae TaxID=2926907 RepID=A0A9E7CUA5_9FLAO|nr:DUF4129 domain-containing protein [Abyssalbus ytuae]UOB18042.1 DUF4129 domain-containing protein [Abyssalbus ytuae]